jgi:hypothetical protein
MDRQSPPFWTSEPDLIMPCTDSTQCLEAMTPSMRFILCVLASVLLIRCSPAAQAQEAPPSYVRRTIPAVRTDTPPVLDGDLSDACWKDAPKAQVFLDQQQGTAAPDQTEAFVLYDARYIYIAFSCKDSRPDQIVAGETVRDIFTTGVEDNVEVIFDTFLTHQRADFSRFSVNPLGTRAARLAGGRAHKAEW